MTQNEKEMRLAFYQLEKYYRPLFDLLTEQQDKYSEYKGGVTIDSLLRYEPDVLILGYNPAQGKYDDYSKDGAHLVYTGARPFGPFEPNNAKNNSYPRNIIEFLVAYTKSKRDWSSFAESEKAKWVEKHIMLMNLYPIATDDGATLQRLFSKLIQDESIISFYGSCENEWELRKHLLYKLHKFIDNHVKPKTILCLGQSTISDYSWGEYETTAYEGVFRATNYKNVYGVSRSGTWTNRVRNVAELIQKTS